MVHTTDTFVLPAPLPLEEGGLLVNTQVAYEAYGELTGENCILLLHDWLESHRALGPLEFSSYRPSGWARELVGEGRIVDPTFSYVLSPNLLGSPFGSTSPASARPAPGGTFGADFPVVTVQDMARAIGALLRGLNIRRVRGVIGVGLGGMVALELAALFPDLPGGNVLIGAAHSLPVGLRDELALTRQILKTDPAFLDGSYPPGRGPKETLRKLRLDLLRRIWNRPHLAASRGGAAVDEAMQQEAREFSDFFDANSYAALAGTLARADLSERIPLVKTRTLFLAGLGDEWCPPSRSRDTYHLVSASGSKADYYEFQADGGHAFLLEDGEKLRGAINTFLTTADRTRAKAN